MSCFDWLFHLGFLVAFSKTKRLIMDEEEHGLGQHPMACGEEGGDLLPGEF
jgi:hypothetical protein